MVFTSCSQASSKKRSKLPDTTHHLRGIRKMEVLKWRAHRAFRLNGPTIAEMERMAQSK